MTVPYAEVIGDSPAVHWLTRLHHFFLTRMAVEGEFRALPVAAHELKDYFEARQRDEHWRGCTITSPHKLAALAFAPHRTDPSFSVEPIALARRKPDGQLEGHALDSMAIVQSLLGSSLKFGAKSGPALVIGAGGGAQAAMWALAHFGCSPIWVMNRSSERAEAVAEERRGIDVAVLPQGAPTPAASIVVNATPLGMAAVGEVEIDLDSLPDSAIVYDMVCEPLETTLVRRARERGLVTFDGLDALVPLAVVSFGQLFGKEVPRAMWAEARAEVLR